MSSPLPIFKKYHAIKKTHRALQEKYCYFPGLWAKKKKKKKIQRLSLNNADTNATYQK